MNNIQRGGGGGHEMTHWLRRLLGITELNTKLDQLIYLVAQQATEEQLMAVQDDLEAKFEEIKTAVTNAGTAIKSQEKLLLEAIASNDMTRVQAVADGLGALAAQLNADVAAGTDGDATT